jgi:hypothetical protein
MQRIISRIDDAVRYRNGESKNDLSEEFHETLQEVKIDLSVDEDSER